MKVVVAVCVYDRFENIQEWIRTWELCEQGNSELVIVHNYKDNESLSKFKELCDTNKIKYIPRENKGFDIGAFKDVCKNKIKTFPDYDYLLWCTDDTIPMRIDFINRYIKKFKENIGVVCMEISTEIKLHFRTTGFMIKKEIAKKLSFPDEIITKDDCYLLEHEGKNSFYNQVVKMGFRVLMADTIIKSPMWDMGYRGRKRGDEHFSVFPTGKNKIVFICTIYNSYPQIISSLICQTHTNWELILMHDGTNSTGLKKIIPDDYRIKYIETVYRIGNWGHSLRQWALSEMKEGRLSNANYVCITNADNYYMPVFCERSLSAFEKSNAVAVYCEQIIHSYTDWKVMNCSLTRGFIDCGQVLVKKEVASDIGWNDTKAHSSDWIYFDEIIKKHGKEKFIPYKGVYFVHN